MPSTAPSDTNDNQKRAELQGKIEAAQARQAERSLADQARSARDNAVEFVREHPIATISGALAFGVVLAAVLPGPGRRLTKNVTSRVSNRATPWAALAAEMGLAYASSLGDLALNAFHSGQDALGEMGEKLGDTSRDLGREISHRTSAATENAAGLGRKVQDATERAARKVRSRVT